MNTIIQAVSYQPYLTIDELCFEMVRSDGLVESSLFNAVGNVIATGPKK